ncbi:MAG: carbonic anhydrase [Reyranellaceae bacterium]
MALQRLLDGFATFRTQYYPRHRELYHRLATEGQSPPVLIIGCGDARVDPAILTQTEPGDLFVVRNVGAIVPPSQRDHQFHGTSSAIEFAVRGLKVQHVVILGHALCGGLRALYEGDESPLSDYDFLFNWVKIAQPAKDAVLKALPKNAPVEQVRRAIEQASVINTVANLMTFDWIADRVKSGELAVHGWYFDMTKAQLYAFNPQTCVFDKVDIGDMPQAAVSALDCTPDSVRQRLTKFADVAKAGF